MKSVELPQGRIEYEDVGSGPTLVFVHGVLVDHRIWSGVVEQLSDRFRCVTPRLPVGAHRVPMRAGADLSLPGQAAIVRGLLDALDLDHVTLVGNDTGGAVCQLVVAAAPPRVSRLVLTNRRAGARRHLHHGDRRREEPWVAARSYGAEDADPAARSKIHVVWARRREPGVDTLEVSVAGTPPQLLDERAGDAFDVRSDPPRCRPQREALAMMMPATTTMERPSPTAAAPPKR